MIDRYSLPKMKHVWSEQNYYDKWLDVEIAACEAWSEEGIIPDEDMAKLRHSTYDLDRLNEIFAKTRHDVTSFTRSMTERLGPEGRWIHLGLTSNDIKDTGLSLQLLEASTILDEGLASLEEVLRNRAIEFKNTPMMGRTHGVHAEPITFGLKLALWWCEIKRQRVRMAHARQDIAVGKISGAVGTYATVPPSIEERVCGHLGLSVAPISNQVLQRDRHSFFVQTLALVAASIEKFATEVRHLQRTEVREVEEPFGEGQVGSSAMPHKRNPELSERMCGLARLIRGHSVTALENVALWHERDISHSSAERMILPDSCLALDYILDLFTTVMGGLKVFPKRMLTNIESSHGLVFSQRVLTSLIQGGMSREDAYSLVQSHASRSWDEELDFRELLREDPAAQAVIPKREMDALFDLSYYLRHTEDVFRRIGLS